MASYLWTGEGDPSQSEKGKGLETLETLAPELFISHRLDESEDMHSLLLTDSSTLLIGGLQNHILEIDLNTVQETQKVQVGCRQGLRLLGAV